MMEFIVLAIVVAIPLLALTAFVQVLYLESLRLRTRDLSSLKFFKESLEERIGLETEAGANAFSLIKHLLVGLLGILYFAWLASEATWHAAIFWEAVLAVLLTTVT